MMKDMSPAEKKRAIGMWGLALCVYAAAAGWMFMRFGIAWSMADLPRSDWVNAIVPAYIIGEIAMIPVAGKLVDAYGVRKTMLFAPFLFVIGAMLCVITPTIDMMVWFRFIEGMGGGLIIGLAYAAVGKYYTPDKRGKTNELVTGAFAIGSLFGTAVGYFLTDNIDWRAGFVFLATLMLIGAVVAMRFLPQHEYTGRRPDTAGMVLAAAAFAVTAFYTQAVNVAFTIDSVWSIINVVLIVVLVALLIRRCLNSDDPVIPVRVSSFEKKMIFLMFMFSLCGLGLIQYYFKLYLTYFEFNIYQASLMFLIMFAGAGATSMIGVRRVFKDGAMPWVMVGAALVAVGLMLTNLIASDGKWQMALSLFVFGLGLGCIVTEILCSMQMPLDKEDIGAHTGNLMGVRMVGIVTGNALVTAYIKNIVNSNYTESPIVVSTVDEALDGLLNAVAAGLQYTKDALNSGFMMTVIIMAMAVVFLMLLVHTLGRPDLDALEAYTAEASAEESEEVPAESEESA